MTPPPDLLRSLVDGPSLVAAVQWHDETDSTNRIAAEAAVAGTPEGLLVLADRQTAGRGRRGRSWVAPSGTSLLLSLLLRPGVPTSALGTLPLLTGLVVAETVDRHVPEATVALKWPNDLLVDGRKAGGILVEAADDRAVVGLGVNVDWSGVQRTADLAAAVSLAEVTGRPVDRWRLLAGFVGLFSRRYEQWRSNPTGILGDYRARCASIGATVRITRPDGSVLVGTAGGVDDSGALCVRDDLGATVVVTAGDIEHARTL